MVDTSAAGPARNSNHANPFPSSFRERSEVMGDWPNATASSRWELDLKPEDLQKSTCVLGFIPVIYYSVLLCVGVPGESSCAIHSNKLTLTSRRT